MQQITEKSKKVEYRQGVAVSWVGNKCSRGPTSSYACGGACAILRFRHGRDVDRLLAELVFGNMGIEISTYVRNDNSNAAYHVDFVNTSTKEND